MSRQKHSAVWNSTEARAEFQCMVDFFDGLCVRCGADEGVLRDHIIPLYQGGSDAITNLQPLCRKCNTSKGPECVDHRVAFAIARGWSIPRRWLP